MFRFAFMFLLIWPAIGLADQSVRQFHAQVPANADTVIQELQRQLPNSVLIAEGAAEAMLTYSGLSTPPALASFLIATFPTLSWDVVAPGKAIVVSLTISDGAEGGHVTALINGSFPAIMPDFALPIETDILMETDMPGSCAGQKILSHPQDMATTADIFQNLLKNQGFHPEPNSPQDVSFFIGRSDSCSAILYLQADPDADDTTLVVLRLLED